MGNTGDGPLDTCNRMTQVSILFKSREGVERFGSTDFDNNQSLWTRDWVCWMFLLMVNLTIRLGRFNRRLVCETQSEYKV